EDWRVEAECPSCANWACFTVADTREAPVPDPKARDEEIQRLGAQVWQPINEHRDHPAAAWIDRVGNGLWEDDYMHRPCPGPTYWVYRFKRGAEAAYIWQEDGCWFARGWYPQQGPGEPPDPSEVFSFLEGLDHLK